MLDPVLNSSFGSFVSSLSKIPGQQGSWQGLVGDIYDSPSSIADTLTSNQIVRLWSNCGFCVNAIKNIFAVENYHIRSNKCWRYKPDFFMSSFPGCSFIHSWVMRHYQKLTWLRSPPWSPRPPQGNHSMGRKSLYDPGSPEREGDGMTYTSPAR